MSLDRLSGMPVFSAPHLVELKEVHRKPRKWARRVMWQREREFDIQHAYVPSRQVIQLNGALHMHPALIKELEQKLREQ